MKRNKISDKPLEASSLYNDTIKEFESKKDKWKPKKKVVQPFKKKL